MTLWVVVPLTATIAFVGFIDVVLLTRGSLAPRMLRPGPLRRWLRDVRAMSQLAVTTIAAWPHVLLRVTRADLRIPVATTPGETVARWGSATLWRYAPPWGGDDSNRPAVLLVHALVTRPWILDLVSERSLVRYLLARGHDVYLLDWGDPGPAEAAFGLTEAVEVLLGAEAVVRRTGTARRLHLVGYCSGASVVTARLAATDHADVASFTAVAASIGASGGMAAWVADPAFRPAWLLDGRGLVPAPLIREAFHWMRPRALRSVLARARTRDPRRAAIADALTRWLWEQRRLPGQMLFDLVHLARTDDLSSRGRATVAGLAMDLTTIDTPVRLVVGSRDHLVPPSSSLVLNRFAAADTVVADTGHVGLLVGSAGPALTYPAVSDWIEANDRPRESLPTVPSAVRPG